MMCAGALWAVSAPCALAQTYPDRQVTIVVPFPPGGTADIIARLLAPALSKAMGVTFLIENRPGASGSIGAAVVAKAKPDGYTVLLVTPPILTVNQWLYKSLPYNPQKDFATVTIAATTPNMFVVHPSIPARSLKDLIALAKARPDELTFASIGSGTSHHLCGEMLKVTAGISMLHVPYKGVPAAHQDLLTGRVSVMCENLSNALPHVRSGKLRAIALTAAKRHPQAPELPTMAESGLAGFIVSVWFGFAVPAETPGEIIARLHTEITRALRTREIADRLDGLGLTIVGDSPENFAGLVVQESARWREVVKASGARLD